MNGIELSRAYYEEFGRKVFLKEFADLLPFLAIGFVGSGSDRYGFDDSVSRDHDFEPGFCIFLPGEDVVDRRAEFLLERAYARLPNEFMGIKRPLLSPVGGNRNGVFRTAEFYRRATGSPDGNLSYDAWLNIPEYALCEAVNGAVFEDNYGEFTEIRERLKKMPEDVRLKRIAGRLLIMGQSGQYNYSRCLSHSEPEAASLALYEFVSSALNVFFLLNNEYMPYYKWSFKALRRIDGMGEIADKLSFLLLSGAKTEDKKKTVEELAGSTVSLLGKHGLSDVQQNELERHAYAVNDRIKDANIRNMHILCTV